MRKILFISWIVAVASCKREPLTTYNTPDNVYFNYGTPDGLFSDTLDFSFAYSPLTVEDTLIAVPLAVTGIAAANDRSVNVVIDPASTAVEGTDYELPPAIVHASEVKDTLRILFKRTPELTSGRKTLILKLQPNESLKTDVKFRVVNSTALDTIDMLKFTISVSDILSAGPYWSTYSVYFGEFSLKKVRFINELLGMPLDFWLMPSPSTYYRAMAIYYASTTSRYLSEQAEQGNTIYDENGTPMKMGASYQ